MSRIITREETKRLVRSLEESVPKERVKEFKEYHLFYNGDKGFFWFKEGEQPEWTRMLPISKRIAYTGQRDGSLKRDKLGELDELLYKYLNSSRHTLAYKKIVDFETKGVHKLNRELKVLEVVVGEVEGERYLKVRHGTDETSPQIKNERLQGMRRDILSIAFYQYMEEVENPIRGLENKSEQEEFSIILTEEYLPQWGDFIDGIKGFDRVLAD